MYTAIMKHLKIGEKSDVISFSMATMTFQYGGYLSFQLMSLKMNSVTPIFYFEKQFLIVQ